MKNHLYKKLKDQIYLCKIKKMLKKKFNNKMKENKKYFIMKEDMILKIIQKKLNLNHLKLLNKIIIIEDSQKKKHNKEKEIYVHFILK